jgi:SAM-dependent methyltransferase
MFAPDHQRAAAEIVRVTRPGGTVGLVCWTPDGFIGEMFRIVAGYLPPPAGLQSPLLWGTEQHLTDLFGDAVADTRSQERLCTFRFRSGEEFVEFFRRWYGPTLKVFEALDLKAGTALASDLADLARRFDRHRDGGSIAIPSAYLETVLTLH